jgi:hypothetical protein
MAAAGWAVTSSDIINMHRYNTRFATMNRSFAPAVYEESDDEYVPSVGDWETSAGRRPVTRSMTRGSAQQQQQAPAVTTRLAAVNTQIRSMIADLESVSSRTRSSASRGSSRASATPTRSTHPMMLRSSRR